MKLVLTTPPVDSRNSITNFLPPMHLAYLGGSVRDLSEVQVTLVDSGGQGFLLDEAVDRIIGADPDVVGLSVTSADVRRSLQLLTLLKAAKPGLTTIIGGHHPTAFDWLFLEHVPQVDLVLRGEADLSFPRLLSRLLKEESISGLEGLSYRNNGQVVRGTPQVVEDLDSINYPDRSLFDRRSYFLEAIGIEFGRTQVMPTAAIFTSRGCTHKCTFCSKLTPRHYQYRARSPENIIGEVVLLNSEGYELVVFADENFTYNVSRVKAVCEMLIERNLKMRFLFQGTLHNLSQSVLDLMHRAGFDGAIVGVESGSDAQLRRFKKAAPTKAIGAGIRRAKQANMIVHGSFVYGAPGETPEDRAASRRFLKEVRPHSCTIYELSLYPNTQMWKDVVGESEPKTLEDTRNRTVSKVAGLADQATLDKEFASFWRTYAATWLPWRRFRELSALWQSNPLARLALKRAPRSLLSAFLQLIRGRQKIR